MRAGDDAIQALPVVLVAAEGAEVNIINPNPKLFDSLLLIFAVLFFFYFFFKNCFQNMRFVSLSRVFLLAIDVT